MMSTAIVVIAGTSVLMLAQGLPNPEGIDLAGSWAARNFTDAIGTCRAADRGPLTTWVFH